MSSRQSEPGAEIPIGGACAPGFERVREAFCTNFSEGKEVGAAVAVTVGGEPVVDLWGGYTDRGSPQLWERDTLVNVYSTTKGMTAICALRLVDEGKLDLDAPVAEYWPEFAAEGKEAIPVRMLLNHRAGLAAIRDPLPGEALYDWETMTAALAAEAPWWEPGSKHGYHPITYGWLVGELIRRLAGCSVGTYFRRELAEPLDLDFHIGLDAVHDKRCAKMSAPPAQPAAGEPALLELIMRDPASVTARAFTNPPQLLLPGAVNTRNWRAAEIPAANGHGTARGLARIYGALACGGELDGVRVLSRDMIELARAEESYGRDETLTLTTRMGLGFMLSHPDAPLGPSPGAFGHPGAGGSLGFADPERRIGFGYVMNRMGPHILLDPRARKLIDAVYASV